MKPYDAPDSFWRLCQHFHQGIDRVVPADDEEALFGYLVGCLTATERAELMVFLDKVLARPDANARLVRLWRRSQADWNLRHKNRTAAFFVGLRQRLSGSGEK